MKNVLALCRSGVKWEGGWASTVLAPPPTTLILHAQLGVGYMHMWSVGAARPVQQPEQTH